MRPPKGFENEKYPLRHRLIYGATLGLVAETLNTVQMPIVMSSLDMATNPQPETVIVNPRNADYVEDAGALVRQMSIIDRMRISLKFNMTHNCDSRMETSASNYEGDNIPALHFLWRPIFNVYPEKLDAADEDTGTTVAAILGLTKDATNEDIVPITTTKLPATGPSNMAMPLSTVNDIQVFGDFNMSTNTAMEDHVFDEDLLQSALRRYTNKGALRACMGRTRHVTLTKARPFKNFYLDKPVPRQIRRVQPYGYFAIQVHMPFMNDVEQSFLTRDATAGVGHLGIKMIVNYHEWNFGHDQSILETAQR